MQDRYQELKQEFDTHVERITESSTEHLNRSLELQLLFNYAEGITDAFSRGILDNLVPAIIDLFLSSECPRQVEDELINVLRIMVNGLE